MAGIKSVTILLVLSSVLSLCLAEVTVEPLRCYHCSENENCNENLGQAAPCRSVYDRCATFYDSATAARILGRGCFTYFSGCYCLPNGKVVCLCPEDDCNSRLLIPGPNIPERKSPLNVKTRFRELHNLNKAERPAFAYDQPAFYAPMPSGNRVKRSVLERVNEPDMVSIGEEIISDSQEDQVALKRQSRSLDNSEVTEDQAVLKRQKRSPLVYQTPTSANYGRYESQGGSLWDFQQRKPTLYNDRSYMTPEQFEYRELTKIKPHVSLDPDEGMINVKQKFSMPGHNLEEELDSLYVQGLADDDPYDGFNPREAYLIRQLKRQGIITGREKHVIPEEMFDYSESSVRRMKPIFVTSYDDGNPRRSTQEMDRSHRRTSTYPSEQAKLPIQPNFHARINLINQHLEPGMIRQVSKNGTIYPATTDPPPDLSQFKPLPTPMGFQKAGVRPIGGVGGGGCLRASGGLFLGVAALLGTWGAFVLS